MPLLPQWGTMHLRRDRTEVHCIPLWKVKSVLWSLFALDSQEPNCWPMFFCKGKGKGKKGKGKHWWKGHSHCHDERTEPAVNASDEGESAAQKPCKNNWYLLTCCHVSIPIHWLILRSGPRLEKKVATLVELQLANEEAPERVMLAFFIVPGSSTYFRIDLLHLQVIRELLAIHDGDVTEVIRLLTSWAVGWLAS